MPTKIVSWTNSLLVSYIFVIGNYFRFIKILLIGDCCSNSLLMIYDIVSGLSNIFFFQVKIKCLTIIVHFFLLLIISLLSLKSTSLLSWISRLIFELLLKNILNTIHDSILISIVYAFSTKVRRSHSARLFCSSIYGYEKSWIIPLYFVYLWRSTPYRLS